MSEIHFWYIGTSTLMAWPVLSLGFSKKSYFLDALPIPEYISISIFIHTFNCLQMQKLEKDNGIIWPICLHIYLSFLRECIKKPIQPIDFILLQTTFTKCTFPFSFIWVHSTCIWVLWRIILNIAASTKHLHFQRQERVTSWHTEEFWHWCKERETNQRGK